MRIAVPLGEGRLAEHFGHCLEFAFFDVDMKTRTVVRKEVKAAPKHRPGILPPWLGLNDTQLIIAGGMGSRALALFHSHGIKVLFGAPPASPEDLVQAFLADNLSTEGNSCNH